MLSVCLVHTGFLHYTFIWICRQSRICACQRAALVRVGSNADLVKSTVSSERPKGLQHKMLAQSTKCTLCVQHPPWTLSLGERKAAKFGFRWRLVEKLLFFVHVTASTHTHASTHTQARTHTHTHAHTHMHTCRQVYPILHTGTFFSQQSSSQRTRAGTVRWSCCLC